jgi:hypothetical protein
MSGHERERLSAYLDGELTAAEQAEVAAHLAACPECEGLLAAFAAVDGEAASLPAEAPDDYFDSFPRRVAARLAAGRPAPARSRRVPTWAWAAAAALLLAVVTPLTLRRAPTVAPLPASTAPVAGRAEVPAAGPPPKAAPLEAAAPRAAAVAPAVRAEAKAEAEADFAHAPQLAAPAPADAARAEAAGELAVTAQSAAAAEDRAPEALVVGGVAAPSVAARRSAEAGRAAVGKSAAARTPEEWRRLRDEWRTFAASAPAGPRADEARVRAIEAGWEAWRLSGRDEDEAEFRRDARAYLEREDASQKARVERLLARPRPEP